MRLVVLANESLKEELLSGGIRGDVELIWIRDAADFIRHDAADAFIDLLFENTKERIDLLKKKLPRGVIVNSVAITLKQMGVAFVRINAWPGFLKRPIVEASCNDEELKSSATKIFAALNKNVQWLADKPGFVAPKVVAMIINEAHFALGEGISSKEEIDTAMKLGTNYPYGPFEWMSKIHVQNVYDLLTELSKGNSRYLPAPLLEKEVNL